MKKQILFFILAISFTAFAKAHGQACPGSGDDPALTQKISDKENLILCGFEDHDYPVEKDQRAFSGFQIFLTGAEKPQRVYASEEGVTQLSKTLPNGLNLTEVWEVGDKNLPALSRDITCDKSSCKVSDGKCLLKAPKDPFPRALPQLEAHMKHKKLTVEAEALVDDVFAQALGGDKKALAFFSGNKPKGFEGANLEAWTDAHQRIQLMQKLKCL